LCYSDYRTTGLSVQLSVAAVHLPTLGTEGIFDVTVTTTIFLKSRRISLFPFTSLANNHNHNNKKYADTNQ
jgi:hypothetical protein